jgi:hypothetical protein
VPPRYGLAAPVLSVSILIVIADNCIQDNAHDADNDSTPECRPEAFDIETKTEHVVGYGGRDEQRERIDDKGKSPKVRRINGQVISFSNGRISALAKLRMTAIAAYIIHPRPSSTWIPGTNQAAAKSDRALIAQRMSNFI